MVRQDSGLDDVKHDKLAQHEGHIFQQQRREPAEERAPPLLLLHNPRERLGKSPSTSISRALIESSRTKALLERDPPLLLHNPRERLG